MGIVQNSQIKESENSFLTQCTDIINWKCPPIVTSVNDIAYSTIHCKKNFWMCASVVIKLLYLTLGKNCFSKEGKNLVNITLKSLRFLHSVLLFMLLYSPHSMGDLPKVAAVVAVGVL